MKKAFSLLLALTLLAALAVPALADGPAVLTVTAELANIKKYGNVVLSLPKEELFEAGYAFGDVVAVSFLDQILELPVCNNYSDVDSGMPALFARDEDDEALLAINMGDFATDYGIAVKTTREDKSVEWSWAEGVSGPLTVTIRMHEAGGYYDEYVLHKAVYTDSREDYPNLSDAEFANFRAVETTGLGTGVLFRSCTPINPEHNRNTYADAAYRAAGVTVVMNLEDDAETARAYPGFDESYYATTAFIALNMGVDYAAPDFKDKLAEGLRFFAENPGVYAVHCKEGKDRAGYVVAILECLMGASWDEVAADYMITYYNYYGVTQGDERYDSILRSTILKMLGDAFGVSELHSADLAVCAADYLRSCGLTDETLAALRKNLSGAGAQTETPPAAETDYTVVAGDCLWNLANRFYGRAQDWKRISDANGLKNPGLILIGQHLRIPA